MRDKSSTTPSPSSTRQLPLRASGLHIHDAIPTKTSPCDEIKRKVVEYPGLNVHFKPAEIRTWANKHPAAMCKTDGDLLNRLGFLITRKEARFCKVSHEKLARKLHVCRRTIIRRLKWLHDVGAVSWKNRKTKQGGFIANEYFIKLDVSKPEKKPVSHPPVTPPCDTPVTNVTPYTRAYTTLHESIYTTPCQCTTSCERPDHCARQGKKTTAREKQQTPPPEHKTIAVINCLDGSVYPLTESHLADMAPHYEGIDLRSLSIDLASWYEEHRDKRTNLTVLKKDWQDRFPKWVSKDKYKQTE